MGFRWGDFDDSLVDCLRASNFVSSRGHTVGKGISPPWKLVRLTNLSGPPPLDALKCMQPCILFHDYLFLRGEIISMGCSLPRALTRPAIETLLRSKIFAEGVVHQDRFERKKKQLSARDRKVWSSSRKCSISGIEFFRIESNNNNCRIVYPPEKINFKRKGGIVTSFEINNFAR